MLDPKVTELARTMIHVQFDERREQLRRDIERITTEMAERGMLRSGATFMKIRDLCAREVEIRAQIVWQVLVRVLSTIGVCPSDSLPSDLKGEVESYFPPDLPELTQTLRKAAELVRAPEVPSLTDPRNRALKKVNAEIDLFVLSFLSRTEGKEGQADSPQFIYNFYSPIWIRSDRAKCYGECGSNRRL